MKKRDRKHMREEKLRLKDFADWEVIQYSKPKLKEPILIEGMPGIGNVGKIIMDVLIEETKAEHIMSFFSNYLPSSVFVNQDNLIDIPEIALYHKRVKGQDILFLSGDVQPLGDHAIYRFCELIAYLFKRFHGKYILTLGGIGLSDIPEHPKVYLTGNDKMFVASLSKKLTDHKMRYETKIYGLVGPIMGVSGTLLGVAKRHNIKAASMLSETFGHPVYVGLKAAKATLIILSGLFNIKINFIKLDKEIKQLDSQLKGQDTQKLSKRPEINYIG